MTPLDLEGSGGGGKGGSPRVAKEAPDTLRSSAKVRAVVVLAEGEIAGIPAGRSLAQCVKLNGVPVENADGSRNFEGVSLDLRLGTADQTPLPGFAAQESTTVKNALVTAAVPVDHVVSDGEVDAVRVVVGVNQLTQQNTTNGDLNGASVSYRIEVREGAGPLQVVWNDTISGKTLGGYQRQVRVALPATRPCTVRVVRTSPDSTSAALQNDLYFFAAVNVTDSKLSWPHLAVLGVEVPADAVQGRTPVISAELDWLVCWVPVNYDPVARTYAGIWNGSFKRAWTNNPAWCLYTLIRDELFGLGDRVAPEQIDKWAFYQIGVYCDGQVPDGLGGQEPRFVCDGPINTREAAQSWIARLAAAFRGAFAWTAGGFRPVADMPADPVAVFTNASVEAGAFRYQGVPLSARASAAVVSVRDRADQYRLKPIASWEEPELIERFGWRQRDVSFPFESRRTGGVRFARWVVETDGRTGETVGFVAGGEGFGLTIGDPILISDRHRVNLRAGGRLAAVGASSLTLDAPVALEAARSYTLSTHDDAGRLVEMAVAPGTAGTLAVVPLALPVPAGVAPGHAWILTSDQLSARRYRVLGLSETGAGVQVSAIEEDAGKWARVELGITAEPPPPFILPPGGKIAAPSPISVAEFSRPRVGAAPEAWITVSWPAGSDPRVDRWRVELRPPGAGWQLVGVLDQPTVDIQLTAGLGGAYGIRVKALALALGNESAWTETEYVPAGLVIPLTTPTGVAVVPVFGGFRVTADEHPAPGFRRLLAYVGASFASAVLAGAGEPAGFDVTKRVPGVPLTVWVTADGWQQPESAPAGPFSVTPTKITSPELGDASIGLSQLKQEVIDTIGGDGAAVLAGAEAARDAAQLAQAAAEDAADDSALSATAAGNSASAASGSAALAGTEAAAATAARVAAQSFRDQAGTQAAASVTEANRAAAAADDAEAAATAATEAKLQAQAAQGGAASSASAASGSAVTATQQAAAAAAQASLSATYGAGSFSDPAFAQWGGGSAVSATRWASQGSLAVTSGTVVPGGKTLTFTVTAAQADGVVASSAYGSWRGVADAPGFVVDLLYDVSGTPGVDFFVNWVNTAGQGFGPWTPVASVRQGSSGGPARAQWVAKRPANFVGTFSYVDVYVLINWRVFWPGAPSPAGAGSIALYRWAIRPATAEELGSGQVGSAIAAAVSAETTNRTAAIAAEADARTLAITNAISAVRGSSTSSIAEVEQAVATKATPAEAIAALDAEVNAQSGGALASVRALTFAHAELDGDARAMTLLAVGANGKVGTFGIGADDSGSEIDFAADRIRFNGASVFAIDGGVVRIGDARVKRLSIGEQEVDLARLQQNTLVPTHASGVGGFVLISTTPAQHPILGLDISFQAGARGARVTAYMRCWFNGRQGNANYGSTDETYGLRFRGEVYWTGGGSDFRDQEFNRGLYVDEFGQVKSRGSREIVLTFPAIEARAGWNVARLWAIYSDAHRDESFAWMQLWLTVINN